MNTGNDMKPIDESSCIKHGIGYQSFHKILCFVCCGISSLYAIASVECFSIHVIVEVLFSLHRSWFTQANMLYSKTKLGRLFFFSIPFILLPALKTE